MSTSRGSQSRTRPQKHQNRTAFKNDLHDTSRKTKTLNSLQVSGVCKTCKNIIEWKIKYKKYKPLTAPAKCVGCNEKAVKYAYHVLCGKCAADKKVCAKCNKATEINDEAIQTSADSNSTETELHAMLKNLPERKRRTVLRHIQKYGDGEGKITPEIKLHIEQLLTGINPSFNLDDDEDFDFSSEEHSIDNSDEEK